MVNRPHGLLSDLKQMETLQQDRRKLLQYISVWGLAPLVGCGSSGTTTNASATPTSAPTPSSPACAAVPSETDGPFPGDGTNTSKGPTSNVLSVPGIERSDMRSSLVGYGSKTAAGVNLTLKFSLTSVVSSCAAPLANHVIYLWHCDRDGNYSLYSSAAASESYLRAIQLTDSAGVASFRTIFPGCYDGRMPHMHFEIFTSLAQATSGNNDIKTSQLAFPVDVCNTVYATAEYAASKNNFARISFATDGVFSDGYTSELCAATGDGANGYAAEIKLSI
jgi:protocatechuate 3,4-dioxygenase beta subunit